MRRAVLVASTLAAALIVPWAVWDLPGATRTALAAPDRPDRVLAAMHLDQLPFGEPPGRTCDCNVLRAALLVQDDALLLGEMTHNTPVRIPRDGNEWEVLDRLLRERVVDRVRDFQVAVHDDATYEDLLTAMLVARAAGVHARVVQPALPVYPHHGWGGGMDGVLVKAG